MEQTEKETLLGLLSHVFETNEDIDGLVYLDIQKIFYYLRRRLGDDNEIFELLPYYWYIDGTVSDTVEQSVNHGLENGVITAETTTRTGSGKWHQMSEDFSPTEVAVNETDYETAKEELDTVLREDYDVFSSYEEKLGDIYEDAPYEFQDYFKFHVLQELERFANGRPWTYNPEQFKTNISTAEAYLPLDAEFEEFNTLFSRYVNTATRYFDSVKNESREFADRFKQLSESVWRLYCQQLRLLEHDEYYDVKRDEWEDEYERTKKLVTNDLIEFRRLLDVEFGDSDDVSTSRVPEDSAWGQIVSDYLDEPDMPN
jgi:hypothetical protein